MTVSPRTVWVGMIVGLLAMSVTINLAVVFLFAGDSSETLEENWEQRNADWDNIQRQGTVNRKLGWKLKVLEWQAPERAGALVFQLQDSEQKPLTGATFQVMAYHLAHPDQVTKAGADSIEKGLYLFRGLTLTEGYYEFRVDLTHNGQRFTRTWSEYHKPQLPSRPE